MHINDINKACLPIIDSFPHGRLFFDGESPFVEAFSFDYEEISEFKQVHDITPPPQNIMGADGTLVDREGVEYDVYAIYSYDDKVHLQMIMWGMIDEDVSKGIKMDYLQVFKLNPVTRNGKIYQEIEQLQEQPERSKIKESMKKNLTKHATLIEKGILSEFPNAENITITRYFFSYEVSNKPTRAQLIRIGKYISYHSSLKKSIKQYDSTGNKYPPARTLFQCIYRNHYI